MGYRGSWPLAVLLLVLLVPAGARAGNGPDSTAAPAAAPAFPDSRVRTWQTGLLRPDRLQHESLSLTLGLSCGLMSRKPEAALAGGLSMGVLKELWDMRRSRFDWVDLCADILGTAASVGITAAIED